MVTTFRFLIVYILILVSDSQSIVDTPAIPKHDPVSTEIGVDDVNSEISHLHPTNPQVVKNLAASWAIEDSSMIGMLTPKFAGKVFVTILS